MKRILIFCTGFLLSLPAFAQQPLDAYRPQPAQAYPPEQQARPVPAAPAETSPPPQMPALPPPSRPSLPQQGLTPGIQIEAPASPQFQRPKISFDDWLNELRQEAIGQGVRAQTVYYALANVYPDDVILQKDLEQPEEKLSAQQYWDKLLSDDRIERGRQFYAANRDLLRRIAEAYGVRSNYIVALLGIESNYGEAQGGENIVNALVTLAYEGRRADYFRNELIQAMHILDQGNVRLENMKGSWAGAMGYCQFMPSSYLKYGQDFDGDGRVDIWSDIPDAAASTANYLHQNGWHVAEEWGQEVQLTDPVPDELIGVKVRKTLAEWRKLGIRRKSGKKLPKDSTMASLVQPDGATGRSFLVYNNFYVLTRWNRSTLFAIAVGMLADIIGRH